MQQSMTTRGVYVYQHRSKQYHSEGKGGRLNENAFVFNEAPHHEDTSAEVKLHTFTSTHY